MVTASGEQIRHSSQNALLAFLAANGLPQSVGSLTATLHRRVPDRSNRSVHLECLGYSPFTGRERYRHAPAADSAPSESA